MSGPDLLERVRMCLAEVGEDPNAARLHDDYPDMVTTTGLDRRTSWRAVEVAKAHDPGRKPRCWACRQSLGLRVSHETLEANRHACLATRPCMEDCGLERGSSSLAAVLPALVTALLLVLSVAYREPVRTLVWLTPLAVLLLAVVVGCVWLAGRLTARPPMTEHLRDEAAVLIERGRR